jgi:small ligand-binding sensory domain FIST
MIQIASCIVAGQPVMVAAKQAFHQAAAQLRQPISLVIVFLSGDDSTSQAPSILAWINDQATGASVIGCASESIVGTRLECEQKQAASVLVISGLHDSLAENIRHIDYVNELDGPYFRNAKELISDDANQQSMMLLADPYSFPIDNFFRWCQRQAPDLQIIGGYCSGVQGTSQVALLHNRSVYNSGAIALRMPEQLRMTTVVSQGCRPIGDPMIVTGVQENAILGLGGKPALQQLKDLFVKSPGRDQQAMLQGMHLGRAISEYRDRFEAGDFLIRNVIGVEDEHMAVMVTDHFRLGQTVQFHLRDAESADADLCAMLKRESDRTEKPLGCLVFTCNGRGVNLFGTANHDAITIDKYFPNLPAAGMFAAGEFGPVGKQNAVHGFTCVTAFLYENCAS